MGADDRFTAPQIAAEQQLADQTVGLVHLSDFRKRRAEALEDSGTSRGSTPPAGDDSLPTFKKKSKKTKKVGLSFGADEDEDGASAPTSKATSRSLTPATLEDPPTATKKLAANAGLDFVLTSKSKAALSREAALTAQRQEQHLANQKRVKTTEFVIPFVFFEGHDSPGGRARLKKGDQVWRFLDQAKRIGAELAGAGGKGMKKWARVSVDDLMLVKDFLVLPQHYEFYWFMQHKARGYNEEFFPYPADVTKHSPDDTTIEEQEKPVGGLSVPGRKLNDTADKVPVSSESELEGYDADAALTKVVLRPWYEKNKHIYPMSTWKDFTPDVEWSKITRKDVDGNAFFASAS